MSVSFTSDRKATHVGYHITCYAYGSENSWRSNSSFDKDLLINDHKIEHSGNVECDFFGDQSHLEKSYDTYQDPEVQLSNNNARYLLETLGFTDEELYGKVSADDLLGRILMAIAVAPEDPGIPAHKLPSAGAVIINCGRPENYLQKKLEQLRNLVDFAKKHNSNISWG